MRSNSGGTVFSVLAVFIVVSSAIGYGTNLYYVTQITEWGGLEVLRVIGIVMWPLGVLLGWLTPFL